MQGFWIFGYGSLMWRPGFDHARRLPAKVHGFHRSLCIYSHVHRGTPEQPGLVLGLDRGGSCQGVAFEVEAANWDETIAYLRAREQVTSVYLERRVSAHLAGQGEAVHAVTYVADRSHRQYAGKLGSDDLIAHVRKGRGVSGACVDYVRNTLEHLREMRIHDPGLERIAASLNLQAASSNSS